MSHANLADQKAVYFHPSGTINLPAWLGKFARVKDTLDDGFGKLDVEYLTFDRPGESLVASRAYDSPGPSTLSLLAKESVVSNLYTWDVDWDIDVRKQCTDKPVDHPLNWAMIKRFCKCWPSQLRAEEETSINAGNGETVLTVPVTATCRPVIIKPVTVVGPATLGQSVPVGERAPVICAVRNSGARLYIIAPDDVNNALSITDLDAMEHVVVASDVTGFDYSHDGGLTYVNDTTYPNLIAICLLNYSSILTSDYNIPLDELYHSTDGGKSYSLIDNSILVDAIFIIKIACDSDNFYCLDHEGLVYKYNHFTTTMAYLSDTDMNDARDILAVDGLLYVSGFNVSGGISTAFIKCSDDGGVTWTVVYKYVGGNDFRAQFRLASAGHGVIFGMLHASTDLSQGINLDADFHTFILRSVNWGMPGTWYVEYSNEHTLAEDVSIFVPSDIASADVNHAKLVGWQLQLGVLDRGALQPPQVLDYQYMIMED